MKARHLRAGERAETLARRWLEARGLQHVQSNYRCRYGEIDLVMREQACLVVVEVRYRRSTAFGGALHSVGQDKQQRLARATQYFLQRHPPLQELGLRFDLLALQGTAAPLQVDWLRDAFCFD